MAWTLRPDGTYLNSGTLVERQGRGGGGKVPDSTATSGNKPAGTPRATSGSLVPARATKGKNY